MGITILKKKWLVMGLMCLLFTTSAVEAQSIEPIINTIKTKYQLIQANIKTYKVDSMEISGQSTEGGNAITWCKEKELKVLKVLYFGESGKIEWNYYFDNNKLFFALETDYSYNSLVYINAKKAKETKLEAFDETKTKVSKDRFYFNENQLIRWLNEKNQQVATTTQEGKDKMARILEDVQGLRSKLHK